MTSECVIVGSEIRRKEKVQLIQYLKNSVNTFIFGSQGIGKTTLIREVIEDYNAKNGLAIYVDCSLYQTLNAILREILLSLGVVVASKSNYELIKRMKEKTKKSGFTVILDHYGNMKNNEDLNTLASLGLCVCLVSDTFAEYRLLSPTLKSKITNVMKIDELTMNDILQILRENGSSKIRDDVIQKITEKTVCNLTLALNMLRSVEANEGKIVDIADSCENDSKLNEDQTIILQILKQNRTLPSGEVYRLYSEKMEYPKGERCFRNYMEALCKQGLVRAIGKKKGRLYEITQIPEAHFNV